MADNAQADSERVDPAATDVPPADVPPNVTKVSAILKGLFAFGEVRRLPESAPTAAAAAAQLGIPVAAIANSLIFKADGKPLLVMTSGAHRADLTKLAAVLGVHSVEKADADFVRKHTGQPIGGVAPVGHPEPIQTLVDIELSRHPVVWAAGGHPHYVFPTHYDELLRITVGHACEVN